NGAAALFAGQRPKDLSERLQGIARRPAIEPGMEIARRARDRDFGEGKTAQEGRYRGCVFVPLSGIAHEREVGFKLVAVRGEERGEARTSRFLLALEEHADIDRKGSM